MQQVQSHQRWFRSFRRLRLSAILVIATLLFEFANTPIFILGQTSQKVYAQTAAPVVTVTKPPVQVDATPVVTAAPITPTEPAPQPVPVPTPTPPQPRPPVPPPRPVPMYDTVSIASIGLSSRFVTVGTTATNSIDVHPSLVGWWNGSAQPGSPGAAFLDGHNPGVFSRLPSVGVGAHISVSRASGEVFNYTVVHTAVVPLVGINMNAALSVYGGASEGLNLMTCVGTYDRNTGTTDQRLIVYAVRS